MELQRIQELKQIEVLQEEMEEMKKSSSVKKVGRKYIVTDDDID
jgi:hypothetical protein